MDRYIIFHEVVEMLFGHDLELEYRDAHQVVLRAERALVESDGLSWAVYCRFCNRWAKHIGNRFHYRNSPKDWICSPRSMKSIDPP